MRSLAPKVPEPPSPVRPPVPSFPRTVGDPVWDALKDMRPHERRFIRLVLQGATFDDAVKACHLIRQLPVVSMLARPSVRNALQRLAPLLGNEAETRRILRPYALEALALALDSPAVATRMRAANDLTAPASMLNVRNADARRSGADGMPGGNEAWQAAKVERDKRRAAARAVTGAKPGDAAVTVGPRVEETRGLLELEGVDVLERSGGTGSGSGGER